MEERWKVAKAKASKCGRCGFKHSALGCEIVGDTLYRRVRSSKHLLRMAGGAWAFLSALLDLHPEVLAFEVEDVETSTLYFCSREVLYKRSFRRDLGAGEQLVCPLHIWTRADVGTI